ncbi:MAG TPA: hypothetical protein VMA36_00685 [Candidatus Limnocylindria bacterium]|jgi:hypothetical protein|nr:hypothetical protein [Candidatus Limnocylindria bacterium]
MSIHDAAQFVGRFCEVTTRHGKLFGEFARYSTAAFFVRPRWPQPPDPVVLDVREITAIEPLPENRR